MNSIDLKEIKERLKLMIGMIYNVKASIENIELIIEADNDKLDFYPIRGFIDHYVILSYSKAAIDLSKFFKNREAASFEKLFNLLKNSNYKKDLQDLIGPKGKKQIIIMITNAEIEIFSQKSLIDKIVNRRDKVYAHLDNDYKDFELENLEELKALTTLAEKIFTEFYSFFFGGFAMTNPNFWSIENVLKDRKYKSENEKKEDKKTTTKYGIE